MNSVYIVVENGLPYPIAYTSFLSAKNAVKRKHKANLENQIRDSSLESVETILSYINVPENVLTNNTSLYIEKEIYINIFKLPIG